jgi:hypothetical protein
MRYTVIFALLGLFLLGISVGVATAQSGTPTPTPTPGYQWLSIIDTPTPRPETSDDYTCPPGLPSGWLTVTPSSDWLLSCAPCVWTPTPTLSPTATSTPFTPGPGTPIPSPTATSTPTLVPSPTPSLGLVQFNEYGDSPNCSQAVYYFERSVSVSGPGAKWPSVDGRLYGCGPYPRMGTLHYEFDIQYSNPYGGSVCLGFGVADSGGVNIGCISSGSYHFAGDLSVAPGGYYWPGKRMEIYNYGSNIPCNWCDNLSYTARLVVWVVDRYSPTPTPTPTPSVSSYCSSVRSDEFDPWSLFGFDGISITSRSCFRYPDDLHFTIPVVGDVQFSICLNEVRIGDVRIAGYVLHIHYILLAVLAVTIVRIFIRA